MPNLFGLDIAGIVNDSLGSLLLEGTLVQRRQAERTADQPKGEVNYTTSDYDFRGIIEDYTLRPRDGTAVTQIGRRVLILGKSLPAGIVPDIGDSIIMEGKEFRIGSIKRDPAAATYTCDVT